MEKTDIIFCAERYPVKVNIDHLYSIKRVNLILLPLWNGIKYEKVQETREEIHKTFVYLVMILSMNQLKNFLQALFDPFMENDAIKDKKDSLEIFTSILGSFQD